ncbi:hypothetical protein AAFF_G00161030 [Aldrovandia affinis]|uniref:Uncharacterized protein n=1 Tax=Aldrovandia affinis TaxID=143900 RepID=A0AAD7RMR9_9TELE|nr:hypothetical protein AAFF_G00161030 [Aldrovandia affinis]
MIGALTASCGNNCPGLSGLPAPAALERSVREGGVGEQASRKTCCALQGSCSPRAAVLWSLGARQCGFSAWVPALSPPGFYIRESWL